MFGLVKNNTRQEIIDATFIGNMARYLNHSCDVSIYLFSQTAKQGYKWVMDNQEFLFILSEM